MLNFEGALPTATARSKDAGASEVCVCVCVCLSECVRAGMEMRARNTSADVSRCILWQGSAHRPAELVGDHV